MDSRICSTPMRGKYFYDKLDEIRRTVKRLNEQEKCSIPRPRQMGLSRESESESGVEVGAEVGVGSQSRHLKNNRNRKRSRRRSRLRTLNHLTPQPWNDVTEGGRRQFKRAVLVASRYFESQLKSLEGPHVKVLYSENYSYEKLKQCVETYKGMFGVDTLWIVISGIFSLVDSESYTNCSSCKLPLKFLKCPQELGSIDLIKLSATICKTIQEVLGHEYVIILAPPIPAAVALVEDFASHKKIHWETSEANIPVTDYQRYFKLKGLYNEFSSVWTRVASNQISGLLKDKPFESFQGSGEPSLKIFVKRGIINAKLDMWYSSMQNLLSLLLCPTDSDIVLDNNCDSDDETERKYDKIVVLGTKSFTKGLQDLVRNMNVVFIDENVSLDDDGVTFLKELNSKNPDKTLWVILAGVSEVAEPVDDGYPECNLFSCSQSLPAFVYKNHRLGDPDFKEMSSQEVVTAVVKQAIDFAGAATEELSEGSGIFLAPMTPLYATWGGDGSFLCQEVSYACHEDSHKLFKVNPNIPVLCGKKEDWLQITSNLEGEWLNLIMDSFYQKKCVYDLMKKYIEEKPRLLRFVKSKDLNAMENAQYVWSVMMADLFRYFLLGIETNKTNGVSSCKWEKTKFQAKSAMKDPEVMAVSDSCLLGESRSNLLAKTTQVYDKFPDNMFNNQMQQVMVLPSQSLATISLQVPDVGHSTIPLSLHPPSIGPVNGGLPPYMGYPMSFQVPALPQPHLPVSTPGPTLPLSTYAPPLPLSIHTPHLPLSQSHPPLPLYQPPPPLPLSQPPPPLPLSQSPPPLPLSQPPPPLPLSPSPPPLPLSQSPPPLPLSQPPSPLSLQISTSLSLASYPLPTVSVSSQSQVPLSLQSHSVSLVASTLQPRASLPTQSVLSSKQNSSPRPSISKPLKALDEIHDDLSIPVPSTCQSNSKQLRVLDQISEHPKAGMQTPYKPRQTTQGSKIVVRNVVTKMDLSEAENLLKNFGELERNGVYWYQDRKNQYADVLIITYKNLKDAEQAEQLLNICKMFGPGSHAKLVTTDKDVTTYSSTPKSIQKESDGKSLPSSEKSTVRFNRERKNDIYSQKKRERKSSLKGSSRDERYSSVSNNRKKLSSKEETEYLIAKKELKLECDRDLELYMQTPEIHPEYDGQYVLFKKQYQQTYPGVLDDKKFKSLWKAFWREVVTSTLEDEYAKKRKLIDIEYGLNQTKTCEEATKPSSSRGRKDFQKGKDGKSSLDCSDDMEIESQAVTSPATDVFLLDETLKLLEEVSPVLGIFGPFNQLKKEIEHCNQDHAKLSKLFKDENKRLVLRKISEKAKKLSERAKMRGSEKHTVKLQLASVQAVKLLDYVSPDSKGENLYGLDIKALAKATFNKSNAYVIQSIKDLLAFNGIKDFQETDIRRIYDAVVLGHMVLVCKKS